ncbi:hypothetical protein C4D60_Mb01t30510 [Musa balbisiana]|uniref:Uncharacterized protein n=1 Tax=Musa balbisiana TaxID=52838 RepID=A0A4S8JRX9_MUSBA|nr:hypothetical protein C4D60_Mb01t30510 [Musa balbisiana]
MRRQPPEAKIQSSIHPPAAATSRDSSLMRRQPPEAKIQSSIHPPAAATSRGATEGGLQPQPWPS